MGVFQRQLVSSCDHTQWQYSDFFHRRGCIMARNIPQTLSNVQDAMRNDTDSKNNVARRRSGKRASTTTLWTNRYAYAGEKQGKSTPNRSDRWLVKRYTQQVAATSWCWCCCCLSESYKSRVKWMMIVLLFHDLQAFLGPIGLPFCLVDNFTRAEGRDNSLSTIFTQPQRSSASSLVRKIYVTTRSTAVDYSSLTLVSTTDL